MHAIAFIFEENKLLCLLVIPIYTVYARAYQVPTLKYLWNSIYEASCHIEIM